MGTIALTASAAPHREVDLSYGRLTRVFGDGCSHPTPVSHVPLVVDAMTDVRHALLESLRPEDVDALDDGTVAALARRLAPFLHQGPVVAESDGWLDFEGALNHLGMKRGTLYKLTSARTIPFHQDGPGCKLWFLRSELDEWRLRTGPRSPRSTHLRAA